ncbi:DUF3168 domain-containing protein [Thermodesulfitimonas autotrophica]|uniref:DUF3168 domain-containing protein n=1 Tax=Thermodesulfitimonas autotrophica TaxID=1894989 RepID=UPI002FDF45D3
MINVKPDVVAALKADATLAGLVGNRIYFHYPPVEAAYPCISYYELNNRPFYPFYSAGQTLAAEIILVVDVWAKGSTSAIADAVNKVMEGLQFMREFACDLYEVDTGVYHKTMRYRILKSS